MNQEEIKERATLVVESVRRALANGCRHYHPDTGELLADARAILTCMRDRGEVTVQQPRECGCGHREYSADRVLCPECAQALPVLRGAS